MRARRASGAQWGSLRLRSGQALRSRCFACGWVALARDDRG
jgi:hypothetical protein